MRLLASVMHVLSYVSYGQIANRTCLYWTPLADGEMLNEIAEDVLASRRPPYTKSLSMKENPGQFRAPSTGEKFFNRIFGFLVGLGLGLSHNYLVQVRGRKSGKLYSTPIDLLVIEGKRFLVAPRGRTQWVRNAEVAGEVTLKKGKYNRRFSIRTLPDSEKPPILKSYLESFKTAVQRYFPVPAGSPPQHFADVASSYPVFELTEIR